MKNSQTTAGKLHLFSPTATTGSSSLRYPCLKRCEVTCWTSSCGCTWNGSDETLFAFSSSIFSTSWIQSNQVPSQQMNCNQHECGKTSRNHHIDCIACNLYMIVAKVQVDVVVDSNCSISKLCQRDWDICPMLKYWKHRKWLGMNPLHKQLLHTVLHCRYARCCNFPHISVY